MTLTDDSAIAAAAITGDSRMSDIRAQAMLNHRRLGLSAQVFAQSEDVHTWPHALGRALKGGSIIPRSSGMFCLDGPFGFLLRIVTEDVEAYERFFFERLAKLRGIQEVNSSVALSEIKYATALPLDHLRIGEKRRAPRQAIQKVASGPDADARWQGCGWLSSRPGRGAPFRLAQDSPHFFC